MCGRFAVTTDPARLALQIGARDETGGAGIRLPNYNVAPTTDIAAVVDRHDDPADLPTRRIRLMRWGLLPPWAKATADGPAPLINARAETLTSSPAFRIAAKNTRCLIPMDGYYEWKPNADSPGSGRKRGGKTPFYFSRLDGEPLMAAGLWSIWPPERLLTCTVITTGAVGEFASVHQRMPLLLSRRDWDRWLDPDSPAPGDLLAEPPDITEIGMREVSTLVNKVANNGPELIAPVESGNQPVGLF